MVDCINANFVGADDSVDEFGKRTRCREDLIVLLKLAVPARKDLMKMTRLVIAGRLVKDLRSL